MWRTSWWRDESTWNPRCWVSCGSTTMENEGKIKFKLKMKRFARLSYCLDDWLNSLKSQYAWCFCRIEIFGVVQLYSHPSHPMFSDVPRWRELRFGRYCEAARLCRKQGSYKTWESTTKTCGTKQISHKHQVFQQDPETIGELSICNPPEEHLEGFPY